jgi:Fic family protein
MRTYEQTHKWISYRFDLTTGSHPKLWLGLGEAASKIEHLARVPLQPGTAKALLLLYLAKGAAATTAIEGNSLSEGDVLRAAEGNLEVPPSMEYQKQEVENVIGVFNQITNHIANGTLPALTPDLIKSYNKAVLDKLPPKEDVVPGEYRMKDVLVGNVYRGAPPQDCDYLMVRLAEWLNSADFSAPKGMETVFAIIKAIVAHLYLAWIHCFGDGNGRTARLVEFHILMSACVPSPAAHLLSNHYNQTRSEYYRQLANASRSGGEVIPFLEYAVQGLVDGLRAQLNSVWDQTWKIAWENYLHEAIHPDGATDSRRHDLAIELGNRNDWVEVTSIPKLSPDLAALYAIKGPKTVQRDINALTALNLVERLRGRVRARRELVFGFLPVRKWPAPLSTVPAIPFDPEPNGQQPLF